MRFCFRIARASHADLTGNGGLYGDGRWHSRGRPVIYTSVNRALAAMEVLVNLDLPVGWIPGDYVLMEIAIPEGVSIRCLRLTKQLDGWNGPNGESVCRAVGDDWLGKGTTAALEVPSAVIPEERNLIINPNHPDARLLKIKSIRNFTFDARLF